jgi:hypothetical protein
MFSKLIRAIELAGKKTSPEMSIASASLSSKIESVFRSIIVVNLSPHGGITTLIISNAMVPGWDSKFVGSS